MARHRLLLAAAAAIVLLPAAAASPSEAPLDRIPEDLPGDEAAFRGHLDNASEAEDTEALRQAIDAAKPLAEDLLPQLRDLQGDDRAGDVVTELWGSLVEAADAGNVSDGRSLAGSAANHLEEDLRFRVEAWAANRTAVTPGGAEPADGDRFRVPLLVLHPPPEGLGALDAEVAVDPGQARPVAASAELGRGQSTVDPANGTARAASFNLQSATGLDPQGPPATTFAVVTFAPEAADAGDVLTVEAAVAEAADGDGDTLPVLAPDGEVVVTASEGGFLTGSSAAWGGLAAVALLGAGAVVAARRLEV